MAIEVTVKRWGYSMGVVLPKQIVEEGKLRENERILIEVVKEADLSKLFGSLKRKMSGQEFKDMVKEGWRT